MGLGLAIALLGCGGGTAPPGDPDAAPPVPDAPPPPAVEQVDCPVTVDAEVATSGNAYLPVTTTVAAGEIVRFTMVGKHTVRSDDNLFMASAAADGCFQFNAAGTYDFYCGAHGFTGAIVVE